MREAGVGHLVHLSAFPIAQRIKDPVMKAFAITKSGFRTMITDANRKDGLSTRVIGPAKIVG